MQTAERTLSDDVAEKVMGWHRGTCPNEVHAAEPGHRHEVAWHWYAADGSEQALCEPISDYYNPEDAWSPEDNIADAWQVVERLRALTYHVEVSMTRAWWNGGYKLKVADRPWGYEVRIAPFNREWMGHADTAPLAICRAALAAVDQ